MTLSAFFLDILYNIIYYYILFTMFLFTIFVDNEYTAKKMETASKKLGFYMMWQWVKKGKKLVISCDFHKKDE